MAAAAMAAMLGMRPPDAPGQNVLPPPGMLPFPHHVFPGGIHGPEGMPPPPFPGMPPPFPVPMGDHGPIPLDERGMPMHMPPEMLPPGMVVGCDICFMNHLE